MADTSLAGTSAAFVAELGARLTREEHLRKRNIRRAWAMAAVGVLHVFFAWVLVISEWRPPAIVLRKLEPMTWILLNTPGNNEKQLQPRPVQSIDPGYFDPRSLPHFIRPKDETEESNAINLGWGLGRSLACQAGSFENLNSKRRAECRSQPWAFAYDRWGNIMVDVRGIPPKPKEETLRPSDAQARERYTAPRCPTNVDPNAPCLSAIFGDH